MKKLLLLGAGGHGKVAADIARLNGYETIAFLDDGMVSSCMGYPVLGRTEEAERFSDWDVFVSVGNPAIRERMQTALEKAGRILPVLIHPRAVMADSVQVGAGTLLAAGAIVNPEAVIGRGCIINTASSVDHENILRDFVHVSVGSHTAGNVVIGERTWIGLGACVREGVTICADCMIGAGAVVVDDIQEAGMYIGVPAVKQKNKGSGT